MIYHITGLAHPRKSINGAERALIAPALSEVFGGRIHSLVYSFVISDICRDIVLTLVAPKDMNESSRTEAIEVAHSPSIISRIVLSLDRSLHKWSDDDLKMMALWGNARANASNCLSRT